MAVPLDADNETQRSSSDPSKLRVGPAALLPILRLGMALEAFGPYWIVATGE